MYPEWEEIAYGAYLVEGSALSPSKEFFNAQTGFWATE
jgi:hypothetical protein